ncbi:glycosyltransferase [Mucilaginibacter sp. AK015]|uniref:glycosyltransferase n=1 Tax=Mucilaginibacter sp. AK015 TaxID=2723072 RepID=UPI001616D235|nr:glycosyltransferase [Mucilaginibacter sp. AK015]MBB5395351.1 glycosyltransferase involved in cell wall biosynthesis [Mucilaginibacter sp. AK015]
METKPLNIFYEEPDPDRWVPFDRYPRRAIRRLIRGKQRPGGVAMVAINLMEGLKRLGIPYRFNDYAYIKKHPEEIACIIGKPHILFEKKWLNPVIFGAGIYSHPIECPDLFERYPNVRYVLVPGEWMRKMFEPYYQQKVLAWPAGIDTELWKPSSGEKRTDFLIYDKTHGRHNTAIIDPTLALLRKNNLSFTIIRYGGYTQQQLLQSLNNCKAAIYISESETQGLAYQQILATNTPILAWDRGGYWLDPYYYPDKVKFAPVSSVPYWDERCGVKFTSAADIEEKLGIFLGSLSSFKPRDYILENLTLEQCARKYMDIYNTVTAELK